MGGIQHALLIGTLLLVLPLLTLNLNALNPGDSLHGRYTYLPLAGLTLMVATGWHLSGRMQIPLLGVAGLIAVVFAGLTASQEGMWKDDLTLFTVAHQLAPDNGPVARNLANAHVQGAPDLADDGRCREAMPIFEEVTQDFRKMVRLGRDWGMCLPTEQSSAGGGGVAPGSGTLAPTSRHTTVAGIAGAHGPAEFRSIQII